MKYTFFLLTVLLLSTELFSQKCSIPELLSLQKSRSDYFENVALKKSFEYTSTTRDSTYTSINYSYYNLKGKRSANFLHYYKWKTGVISIWFATTERAEYLSLKESVRKLGFTFYRTTQMDEEETTYYKKGSVLVGFNTSLNIDDNEQESQLFSIEINPGDLMP